MFWGGWVDNYCITMSESVRAEARENDLFVQGIVFVFPV